MGIQGLLGALKSSMQDVHIRSLSGLTVGVDVLCWLHKGIYTCATEVALYGVESEQCRQKFLEFCMTRIKLLQGYNITPYMVFDGAHLPTKDETEASRREKRDAAYNSGLDFYRAGKESLAHAQFVKSVDISPHLCYLLIEELQKLGIQYLVAPYEADAQLAHLCRTGVVDAVITEDSDLIAYCCPRILFKLDKNGEAREWRRRWLGSSADTFKAGATSVNNSSLLQRESSVQLERLHQYDDELLILMCVLAGCDYCPSLPNVGIKKANMLVNTYKKNWRLMLKQLPIRMKIPVDKTYVERFEKALLTFRHQRVFDPRKRKLVCLNPLPKSLFPPSIDPSTLQSDSLSWHGYGWPDDPKHNLDFLGRLLSEDVSCSIADGLIDPFTLKPFSSFRSKTTGSSSTEGESAVKSSRIQKQIESESRQQTLHSLNSFKHNRQSTEDNSWSGRSAKRKREGFFKAHKDTESCATPAIKATKGRPELARTVTFSEQGKKSSYFFANGEQESSNVEVDERYSYSPSFSSHHSTKQSSGSYRSTCSNPRQMIRSENVTPDFTPFYKRLSSNLNASRVRIDFDSMVEEYQRSEKPETTSSTDASSSDENYQPPRAAPRMLASTQQAGTLGSSNNNPGRGGIKETLFQSFSYKGNTAGTKDKAKLSPIDNTNPQTAQVSSENRGFEAVKPSFTPLF
eukprot:gb/GECG01013573.1/.p1 GENE.gb/GECG01013573.1/~~gb/GECG01013573.1/.p1  ORF type:complete len:686 (+),score=79.42 gb/GECG01013573.1/:1-2058(+)